MSDVEKDWTIMVYMAGDNNLSENMAYSLADLGKGYGNPDVKAKERVNLLAFFDGSSLTAPTKYIDFSGDDPSERIHQVNPPDEPIEIDLPNDVDAASARSIMNFVRWCIRDRGKKAKNYALIFSGHSFGFHGTSFLRDETSSGFITLFGFRWALEEIAERYLGKKLAILGFDSCVMSMLEVAYELRKTAQTLVASEGSLPNAGWGYAPLLKEFVSTFDPVVPSGDKNLNFVDTPEYVRLAAASFVKAFIEHHNELLIGGRSVDIAAWDLELLPEVVEGVDHLGESLNSILDLTPKVNDGSLEEIDIRHFHELKKVILQCQYDAQSFMKNQCVDLVDFCQRLMLECEFLLKGSDGAIFEELHGQAKKVIDDVRNCILVSGYSGDEYQYSNGISIYFPWTYLTFSLTRWRYQYLQMIRADEEGNDPTGPGRHWYSFLKNYLSRVTFRLARNGATPQTTVGGEAVPPWSKDNPRWSKDNPRWSKDNPRLSRDNPRLSKDNPRISKDNPRLNRGEVGEYLFYFERFKNFQMAWDIHGYTKKPELSKEATDSGRS